MIHLLYISTATQALDRAELALTGELAARNNARDGITGLLCFNGRNFMQLLEGSSVMVDALMKGLQADVRHSGIVTIYREKMLQRYFPQWSMHVAHVSADSNVRMNEIVDLLPKEMNADLQEAMLGFGSLR